MEIEKKYIYKLVQNEHKKSQEIYLYLLIWKKGSKG